MLHFAFLTYIRYAKKRNKNSLVQIILTTSDFSKNLKGNIYMYALVSLFNSISIFPVYFMLKNRRWKSSTCCRML